MTTPTGPQNTDAIQLSIFHHLLAAVAEEMGAALMKAAFSPNIKERRDFSCAIFDRDGEMLAQAAHIPVHLGSQPLSVQAAIAALAPVRGQSVLLNDPYCGGTHLPDITLVTPVFDPSTQGSDPGDIWFFVSNRAHHADVGGTTPGSMPLCTHIDDEGIRIPPTVVDDALLERIAQATRTPDERSGDLRAQQAANHLATRRLIELAARFGVDTLHARGASLLDYSERLMRAAIRDIPDGVYTFEDALDNDGISSEPVPLRVRLKAEQRCLVWVVELQLWLLIRHRHHLRAVPHRWRQDAVVAHPMRARARDQGAEPLQKLVKGQHQVGRPVRKRGLQL